MPFFAPLFVIHLLALMTPGPDSLLVGKTAMAFSRRAAVITALGVGAGNIFWVLLVLMGLHWLFETFAWLQGALRIAGGAYLFYMGVMMLRASFQKADLSQPPPAASSKNDKSAFYSGLFTNLANPKAMIYFGSIFATFLTGSISIPDKAIVFVLVVLESTLWFVFVAVLFSLPAPRRAYQRANKWIDRIAGLTFGGFGLRLLFSSRH